MNNPKDLTSKYITNENGDKMMYNDNNELHSFNDLPAVISRDGSQEWYQNGKQHRDNDLPAAIYSDGSQNWYQKWNFT